MDTEELLQTLTSLIEYFEAGNTESDAVAKAVLIADSKFDEYWRPGIERFRKSIEWTGLRASPLYQQGLNVKNNHSHQLDNIRVLQEYSRKF